MPSLSRRTKKDFQEQIEQWVSAFAKSFHDAFEFLHALLDPQGIYRKIKKDWIAYPTEPTSAVWQLHKLKTAIASSKYTNRKLYGPTAIVFALVLTNVSLMHRRKEWTKDRLELLLVYYRGFKNRISLACSIAIWNCIMRALKTLRAAESIGAPKTIVE